MRCLNCQHENPVGAKFCLECGGRLALPTPVAVEPAVALPKAFAAGRYRVERFLGEGAKKRVYLARDTKLDREVALAVIKADGLDPAGRVRVEREAQAMARLGDHPHIVTVHDIGEDAGELYIVSQYMAGGSLADQTGVARLPFVDALRIAAQIASALEHAHTRGVIHRDVKPGNIWLMADGTAKLGDFGLALALDRSRMTAEGMMVGTVAYMAPEQALGGEVTARADLYALGAVLYELVTGRPVFVGDDAVAIVSQHLNTAPIDPSWHEPSVPRALEALILRLLEKDPAKRPQSAQEVSTTLASLDVSPAVAPAAPTATDPVYRRTFVGREAELRQLQAAFDAALSGHGSLVTVVGEPGIGKTSVCEQLATYAAMRGGRALVGHCYEEGSLSLPYLPFVEAMRSYVATRDADALRSELGSGASDVARIVSEVRERVDAEPAMAGDPDEARYRLLQAVTTFLRNAAAVAPLVIVLEDLHDADRGTLDMLTHVARSLEGARLLIIGTYRDVEVDRTHPLSAALAELRRLAGFARIALRGLSIDEVQRMLAAIARRDVPWSLAESVHRSTEGNPLFVQEVMRHLAEEGLLGRDGSGARALTDSQLAASIPEGLRDVIGRRLSRLSAECNRVLAIAAVIGREFRLDTLCAIATVSEDAVISALEEAVRVAVLVEEARGSLVRYRFAHAFFRQTLYEESIAPRRIRIHQQVARALESQYAARLDEHAAELADHFSYSSDPADLAKAVRYGELAASRASAVSAYTEAVHHLERALQVQEVLDPDDRAKRCDLLLALGGALLPAGEPQRTVDTIGPEAFALAEALADSGRAARSAHLVCTTLGAMSAGLQFGTAQAGVWLERAERYSAPRSVDRVWADLWSGVRLGYDGAVAEAQERIANALALARELDEPAAEGQAAYLYTSWCRSPGRLDEMLALARERLARLPTGMTAHWLAQILVAFMDCIRASGARREADASLHLLEELAARSRDPQAELMLERSRAQQAILAGDLERALEIATQMRLRAEQLGLGVWALFAAAPADFAAALLGKPSPLLEVRLQLPEASSVGPRSVSAALYLARAGRADEARSRLLPMLDLDWAGPGLPVLYLMGMLETALLIRERNAAAVLAEWLAPAAVLSHVNDSCPARLLGGAASLLGKSEQARAYYLQALERAGAIDSRPELALTHLELAELLLEQIPSERDEAKRQLEIAIPELRAMKMQPALERALRHKLALQGVGSADLTTSIDAVAKSIAGRRPELGASIAPDGTVTLMFSDMEDFTRMTERLGDREAYRVIQEHNRIVREQLAAHRGHELELQGDGFLLAFALPEQGVRCAIAIQRAFAAYSAAHAEQPIRVRIGLHRGEAIKDRDKFFGRTVILAARIAAQARGGEILISSALAEAAASASELGLGPARELELKGIAEPQAVRALLWEQTSV